MDIKEKVFFKRASRENCSIIHQLALEIWPKAFETILTPEQIGYMLDMMYAIPVLQEEMERGVEYYILNYQSIPAGYTAIEKTDAGSWKLHKIYLSQQLHGKGLGKLQLQHATDRVKSDGGRYLYLNVNRQNNAVGFYQSQGFEIVTSEDIAIGRGYFMNDYVMRKKTD